MAKRGQSPDEYVAGDEEFPPAIPRPSFGPCLVASCTRFAWRARPALCEQHYKKWDCAGRPAGTSLRSWCARQRSIDRDSRVVVLAGLAEGMRLEVLYGLQRAAETGRRTRPADVQATVNILRAQQVTSLRELAMDQITRGTQAHRFLTFTADQVTLALATPASETAKDDWDLRVFSHIPGLLRFSPISQQWLKETAKTWAADRIDTVQTPRVMQAALRSLRALSESLRRNRPDGGTDPRLIARADLAAFASDLSHLEAQGRLSPHTRRYWLLHVGQFLAEARAMGLSLPGARWPGFPKTSSSAGVTALGASRQRSRDGRCRKRSSTSSSAQPRWTSWRPCTEPACVPWSSSRPGPAGAPANCAACATTASATTRSSTRPASSGRRRCSSTTCRRSPSSATACPSTKRPPRSSASSRHGSGHNTPAPPPRRWPCSPPT